MGASAAGNLDIAKILVDVGADINYKSKTGETASDIAKKKGNLDIYDFLNSISKK